ncbi:MAG: FHA domain-containing protein [Armatimonadota bacterium]|nr:FHA domain-containing protein [bacterium]MCS7308722.1 FHA domain-containing protein [Armatimonadota bacterium]MDW8103653.1 FHA domain-containing protein [Armatimonadota bacterium]MDW8289719.1 FHA domain-containing protein [Armatimonadota bacterium]
MPRVACVMLMLLWSAVCWSLPDKVTVNVPSEGKYLVWLESADGRTVFLPPVEVVGGKVEMDIASLKKRFADTAEETLKGARVGVYDMKFGNLALVTPQPNDATVTITPEQFRYAMRVQVRLQTPDDKPIAAAFVMLTDAENTIHAALLEPSKGGVVSLERVRLGKVSVLVNYGNNLTASQEAEIQAERADPVVTLTMVISSGAPILEGASSAPQPAASAQPAAPAPSPTPRTFPVWNTLLGLLVLAGVIYGGYRLWKGKQMSLPDALKKLGIDVAQETPPSPAQPASQKPTVPEGHCPFCGQPIDPVTGACACSVAPAAPAAASSTATATAVAAAPRLVGSRGAYSGTIFEITGSEASIGREAGNTIQLSNDNTVSRRHARLLRQGDGWTIRDEGSSNGTWVNGVRVTEHQLRPGDEIQIGATFFRWEV